MSLSALVGSPRGVRRSSFDAPLRPGERLLHQARPHWVVLAGPALVVTAVLGAAALTTPWVALLALPAARALARRAGAYRATSLVLTNARLIVAFGNFHPQIRDRLLCELDGVGFEQGPWGLLLSYGTVVVYDGHGGRERFTHIAGGRELARRADECLLAGPAAGPVRRPEGAGAAVVSRT